MAKSRSSFSGWLAAADSEPTKQSHVGTPPPPATVGVELSIKRGPPDCSIPRISLLLHNSPQCHHLGGCSALSKSRSRKEVALFPSLAAKTSTKWCILPCTYPFSPSTLVYSPQTQASCSPHDRQADRRAGLSKRQAEVRLRETGVKSAIAGLGRKEARKED